MSKSITLSIFVLAMAFAMSNAQFGPEELETSTCTSGKRKGNACCLASCAVCGGPDCNIDMQGDSCCVTKIRESGRDCRFQSAPCVIPPSSPSPRPTTTATRTATPTSTATRTASPLPVPADPFCLTGIIGTKDGFTVCCSRRCGKCGGAMCGKLPGGVDECCKPAIIASRVSCSVSLPPCIVTVSTPRPTTTATAAVTPTPIFGDPFCRTGFVGSRFGRSVCCLRSCGQCGGMMCAELPGGTAGCCIPRILRDNVSCLVARPPCVLSSPVVTPSTPAPSSPAPPTPFPPGTDPLCLNGIIGSRVEGDVCCLKSCGQCGGMMCGNLPGGVTNCCINKILDDGNSCTANVAPCVIRGPGISRPPSPRPTTPTPVPGDPNCSTGIRGVRDDGKAACCRATCGRCGGGGCADLPGGAASCCIFKVFANQPSCNVAGPPCSLGIVAV